MQRRYCLTAGLRLALLGAGFGTAAAAQAQPRYTVSLQVLQQTLAQRFPLRYPVQGLLNLDVQTPALRLLPAQNRLGAAMQLQATGPVLGRSYSGSFDVDFALRYEASDHTLRAYQLHFQNLQFPELPPELQVMLGSLGPALSKQSLQEVVLHTLRPQDLALADTMGLQPDTITVTAQGLVIGFVNKPL
jgi:hypothetical protein